MLGPLRDSTRAFKVARIPAYRGAVSTKKKYCVIVSVRVTRYIMNHQTQLGVISQLKPAIHTVETPFHTWSMIFQIYLNVSGSLIITIP